MEQGARLFLGGIHREGQCFPHKTIRLYFGFLSQIDSLLAKLLKFRSARSQESQTRSAHCVECLLIAIGGGLGALWSGSPSAVFPHLATQSLFLDRLNAEVIL
jgi:hypothetical protein